MWLAIVRRRLIVFASPTRSSLPRTTCFTLGLDRAPPLVPAGTTGPTAAGRSSRRVPQSTGLGVGPSGDHGRRTAPGTVFTRPGTAAFAPGSHQQVRTGGAPRR